MIFSRNIFACTLADIINWAILHIYVEGARVPLCLMQIQSSLVCLITLSMFATVSTITNELRFAYNKVDDAWCCRDVKDVFFWIQPHRIKQRRILL